MAVVLSEKKESELRSTAHMAYTGPPPVYGRIVWLSPCSNHGYQTNRPRYIVLDIFDTVLFNCFIFGLVEYTSLNVALSVLSELSNLLALGIILMPLTLHILHRAGQKNKIVIIINGTALGAVALLMVPFLVLNNMSSVGSLSTSASFEHAAHTFAATYYTTYFAAAIVGFLLLFFSLVKAARDFAITLV